MIVIPHAIAELFEQFMTRRALPPVGARIIAILACAGMANSTGSYR
jgi:hypothetical protein